MNLRRRGRRVLAAVVAAVLVAAAVVAGLVVASRPAPIGVRNLRIGVTDGPRDDQHVLAGRHVLHPGRRRQGTGHPARARLRRDEERRAAGGRAAGPGRVRGADLVGARLRPVHRADRPGLARLRGQGRRAAGQLAGAVSRGSGSTIRATPGSASPGPPTAGRSRCWPPPTTTGSTPSSRRSPGTTWPPRCSRTRPAAGRPAACSRGSGPACCSPRASTGGRDRQPRSGQRTGHSQPVRPLPARDLRHLPAGRDPRAGHAAGRRDSAAVQPGQRRPPDGRPDPADPGRARLAVRPGPGQRQLPGHPAQRRPRGHGLVRRRRTTAATRRPAG